METTLNSTPLGKQALVKLAAIVLILSLLLMGSASTARAESAITFNLVQEVPIQFSQYVPCAAGGAGEMVKFSGALKMFIHGTLTGNNRVTFSAKAVPNEVLGVGQVTGDVYRTAGSEGVTNTYSMGPAETWTARESYLYVGSGTGNDFYMSMVTHETLNADGTLTATVENESTGCR